MSERSMDFYYSDWDWTDFVDFACKSWTYWRTKGLSKKNSFLKNCDGSGGRTVWPRRLSFSQFIILMSTTNCEKDSLLGQTVLPPEPSQFFKKEFFLDNPLVIKTKVAKNVNRMSER